MQKVLHIINGEFFAGAERVQDLLALKLPGFGYECFFICLKEGVFTDYRQSRSPLEVMTMRSRYDLSLANRIFEKFKSEEFCLVHTHTARGALIGRLVAHKLKVPWVHHVHSPAQRDTESKLRNFANSLLEDQFIFPSATRLIAVSSSLKGYLISRGVNSKRITVVPNGVPVLRSEPAWKPPTNGWVIGTAALFRPRKGIEVLLRSLRMLLDQGLDVSLKAVGVFESNAYEKAVKNLASELGLTEKVQWTGFSNDVQGDMESMHIFALPSLFGEGLPMVIIEAMSIGIPIVASRVEGIPEVICGQNYGIIVEPNDAGSLSRGLKSLISGDLSALSIATSALTRQLNHYSDTAMAKAVASVYQHSRMDY